MLERTGKYLRGKKVSVKKSCRTKPTPCNVFLLLLSLFALFWWGETVVFVTRSCARSCYKNRNKIIVDFEKSIKICERGIICQELVKKNQESKMPKNLKCQNYMPKYKGIVNLTLICVNLLLYGIAVLSCVGCVCQQILCCLVFCTKRRRYV